MAEMKTLTINGKTYSIDDPDSVSYGIEQELTEEQKQQARANIGAAGQTQLDDAIAKEVYIRCSGNTGGKCGCDTTYTEIKEYLEGEKFVRAYLSYDFDGELHYACTSTIHYAGEDDAIIFDFAGLGKVYLDTSSACYADFIAKGEGATLLGSGNAFGAYSVAGGDAVTAGCNGYYVSAVYPNVTDQEGYIFLSPDAEGVIPVWVDSATDATYFKDASKFDSGYRVYSESELENNPYANEFSVSSDSYNHWAFAGVITEVVGNRIKYKSTTLNSSSKWLSNVEDGANPFIFFVPAQPQFGEISVGLGSHAEGVETCAAANHSHAEGYRSISAGRYGHAEGDTTRAGFSAHAEGQGTLAQGLYSHAEGQETKALNSGAHAEGRGTVASGSLSHSEGSNTTASGNYSHAEGDTTTASGIRAHAEGQNSIASGNRAHAEGNTTQAIGNNSHAEGASTVAQGLYSHAEGYTSKAVGESSHAEGKGTKANGKHSHSEGEGTSASGQASHAEGYGSQATGNNSHAEGASTVAQGLYSHAEGYSTKTAGESSHAEGYNTKANGKYSHSEGEGTSASGARSHAEGYNTQATGDNSHTEGHKTQASNVCSHAEGWSTTASGDTSHAEGSETTASGITSHAEGRLSDADGDYSHAEGYNTTASGQTSHAEGYETKASGKECHAEGCHTEANGDYSHTSGIRTVANGRSQFVIGEYNEANGEASRGANNADTRGNYAFILGNGTEGNPSNAHTIDWDGNAWFAGDVYSKSRTPEAVLVTKAYVDKAIADAIAAAFEQLST